MKELSAKQFLKLAEYQVQVKCGWKHRITSKEWLLKYKGYGHFYMASANYGWANRKAYSEFFTIFFTHEEDAVMFRLGFVGAQ